MAQAIHAPQLPLPEEAAQRKEAENAKLETARKVIELPQTRKARDDQEIATLALFLFS